MRWDILKWYYAPQKLYFYVGKFFVQTVPETEILIKTYILDSLLNITLRHNVWWIHYLRADTIKFNCPFAAQLRPSLDRCNFTLQRPLILLNVLSKATRTWHFFTQTIFHSFQTVDCILIFYIRNFIYKALLKNIWLFLFR